MTIARMPGKTNAFSKGLAGHFSAPAMPQGGAEGRAEAAVTALAGRDRDCPDPARTGDPSRADAPAA